MLYYYLTTEMLDESKQDESDLEIHPLPQDNVWQIKKLTFWCLQAVLRTLQ